MAWIESHQELPGHPKTKKLVRLLRDDKPRVVGHLHMLWWWALEFAPDGDITKYAADDIADAVEWKGEPELLLNSLIEAKFVDKTDDGLRLHDWDEYGGKLLAYREVKVEKDRIYEKPALTRAVKSRDGNHCRFCGIEVNWKDRKGANGGTYDRIGSAYTVENTFVSCRSCKAKNVGNVDILTEPARFSLVLPIKDRLSTDKDKLSTDNQPNIHENLLYSNTYSNSNTTDTSSLEIKTDDDNNTRDPGEVISEPEKKETTENPYESFYAAHKRVFGFVVNPLQSEELGAFIDKDKMDEAVVVRAIERTAVHCSPYKFKYITGILSSYLAAKAMTLESAIAVDDEFERKAALKKNELSSRNVGNGNRTRGRPSSGKKSLPTVEDREPTPPTMKTKEEYRAMLDRAHEMQKVPLLSDKEFEMKWELYQIRRDKTG